MLTKEDLQNITRILEEVLEKKLEEKLEEKLEQKLEEKFEIKLKPIWKEIRKIRRDLKVTINYFDRVYLDHEVRIKVLEEKRSN